MVVFEDNAFESYSDWAKENYKTFERIRDLIKDIKRDPVKGIGKPEPLKYDYKGYRSRRIDDKHRLIYRITAQNEVAILSSKGHYD